MKKKIVCSWLLIAVMLLSLIPGNTVRAMEEVEESVYVDTWVETNSDAVISGYEQTDFLVEVPEQDSVLEEEDGVYLVKGELMICVTVPQSYDISYLKAYANETELAFSEFEENKYTVTFTPDNYTVIRFEDKQYYTIYDYTIDTGNYTFCPPEIEVDNETYGQYVAKHGEDYTFAIDVQNEASLDRLCLMIDGIVVSNDMLVKDENIENRYYYTIADVQKNIRVKLIDRSADIYMRLYSFPEEGYRITDADGNAAEFIEDENNSEGSCYQMKMTMDEDFVFYIEGPSEQLSYGLGLGEDISIVKSADKENTYVYTVSSPKETYSLYYERKARISLTGEEVKVIPCDETGEALDGYEPSGVREFYVTPAQHVLFKIAGEGKEIYRVTDMSGQESRILTEDNKIMEVYVGDDDVTLNVEQYYCFNTGLQEGYHVVIDELDDEMVSEDESITYVPADFRFNVEVSADYMTKQTKISIEGEDGTDIPYEGDMVFDAQSNEYIFNCQVAGIDGDISLNVQGLMHKSEREHSFRLIYSEENFAGAQVSVVDARGNILEKKTGCDEMGEYSYYVFPYDKQCFIRIKGEELGSLRGGGFDRNKWEWSELTFNQKEGCYEAEVTQIAEARIYNGDVSYIETYVYSGEIYQYNGQSSEGQPIKEFTHQGKVSFYIKPDRGYRAENPVIKITGLIDKEEIEYTSEERIIDSKGTKAVVYSFVLEEDVRINADLTSQLYRIILPDETEQNGISSLYAIDDYAAIYTKAEKQEDGYHLPYDQYYCFCIKTMKGEMPPCATKTVQVDGEEEVVDWIIPVKSNVSIEEAGSDSPAGDENVYYWYSFWVEGDTEIKISEAAREISLIDSASEATGRFETDGERWKYYRDDISAEEPLLMVSGLPQFIPKSMLNRDIEFYIGDEGGILGGYKLDERKLDTFLTAYKENDENGLMLKARIVEDDGIYYTLPAGYTTIKADTGCITEIKHTVTFENNRSDIELEVLPEEGKNLDGDMAQGYRFGLLDKCRFRVTAKDETAWENLKISSDGNYNLESDEGLSRIYCFWCVRKDTTVSIGWASSVKLVNDKKHVTLSFDRFEGNAASGFAAGNTITVRVKTEEGYNADSVRLSQLSVSGDKETKTELLLTNTNDETVKTAEIILAVGENRIEVTEPEKAVYQITLPKHEAYMIEPCDKAQKTAGYGDNYSFKVIAAENFDISKINVTVNGRKLTADKDGIYTIQNIKSNCNIEVEGYVLKTYRVIFKEDNGKILKAEDVEAGGAATAPEPPKRRGYTFAGWDKGFNNVRQDITVTAVYRQVVINKIVIKGDTNRLAAGKSVVLTAVVFPNDALNQEVVWSTGNKKYAEVNANGKVKAKKAGAGKTLTITAEAKDGSGTKAVYNIRIYKNAVKKIRLSVKSKTVAAGKKVRIKAKVSPAKDVNKVLKWSTNNKKYATVNAQGVVSIKKAGKGKTVKITARATDGSKKKAEIKLKIRKK